MGELEALSIIVGRTVALFPKNVASMLVKNGVRVDAENYNSEELISATFDGLKTSQGFFNDFVNFVELNKEVI